MNFVYVKPGLLDTQGYAYGKGKILTGRTSRARVERLASGRWSGLPVFSASLDRDGVRRRVVSEDEALSGIGTYMGSCVCVPRIRPNSPLAWDYGVVVGHDWKPDQANSVLHVQFGEKTEVVTFDESVMQDIAAETYALRPCHGRPVVDIMPAEMRDLHEKVYSTFSEAATRDSATTLGVHDLAPIDERGRVPLYELSTSCVLHVPIKHVLDFAYYRTHHRPIPTGIHVGDTVFDFDEADQVTDDVTRVQRPGQRTIPAELSGSDSDEVSNSESAVAPKASTVLVEGPTRKRKRAQQDIGVSAVDQAPSGGADGEGLMKELEEFLAFKRGSTGSRPSTEVASSDKVHFRPSAMQSAIHRTLVNGAYYMASPLVFLETLQTDLEHHPIVPHPAVLRGLYSWEFGTRGLSILHFARRARQERRDAARQNNLADFSLKNGLPRAIQPRELGAVIDALEILGRVVRLVYKTFVNDVVIAALDCVRALADNQDDMPASSLDEIVDWIDHRLQNVRACVSRQDLAAVSSVIADFDASSSAHQRLLNVIIEQRIDQRIEEKLNKQRSSAQPRLSIHPGIRPNDSTHKERRAPPEAVLSALPIEGGKSMCMRFISKMRCHSTNDGCWNNTRGHFKPNHLPPVVKSYINKQYGGLRDGFQDL